MPVMIRESEHHLVIPANLLLALFGSQRLGSEKGYVLAIGRPAKKTTGSSSFVIFVAFPFPIS